MTVSDLSLERRRPCSSSARAGPRNRSWSSSDPRLDRLQRLLLVLAHHCDAPWTASSTITVQPVCRDRRDLSRTRGRAGCGSVSRREPRGSENAPVNSAWWCRMTGGLLFGGTEGGMARSGDARWRAGSRSTRARATRGGEGREAGEGAVARDGAELGRDGVLAGALELGSTGCGCAAIRLWPVVVGATPSSGGARLPGLVSLVSIQQLRRASGLGSTLPSPLSCSCDSLLVAAAHLVAQRPWASSSSPLPPLDPLSLCPPQLGHDARPATLAAALLCLETSSFDALDAATRATRPRAGRSRALPAAFRPSPPALRRFSRSSSRLRALLSLDSALSLLSLHDSRTRRRGKETSGRGKAQMHFKRAGPAPTRQLQRAAEPFDSLRDEPLCVGRQGPARAKLAQERLVGALTFELDDAEPGRARHCRPRRRCRRTARRLDDAGRALRVAAGDVVGRVSAGRAEDGREGEEGPREAAQRVVEHDRQLRVRVVCVGWKSRVSALGRKEREIVAEENVEEGRSRNESETHRRGGCDAP